MSACLSLEVLPQIGLRSARYPLQMDTKVWASNRMRHACGELGAVCGDGMPR